MYCVCTNAIILPLHYFPFVICKDKVFLAILYFVYIARCIIKSTFIFRFFQQNKSTILSNSQQNCDKLIIDRKRVAHTAILHIEWLSSFRFSRGHRNAKQSH